MKGQGILQMIDRGLIGSTVGGLNGLHARGLLRGKPQGGVLGPLEGQTRGF